MLFILQRTHMEGQKCRKLDFSGKIAVSTIIQDDLTPLEFLPSFEELGLLCNWWIYTQKTYVVMIVITESVSALCDRIYSNPTIPEHVSKLWDRTTMSTLILQGLNCFLNNAFCITYHKTWNPTPQKYTHDLCYVIQRTKLFSVSTGQHSHQMASLCLCKTLYCIVYSIIIAKCAPHLHITCQTPTNP